MSKKVYGVVVYEQAAEELAPFASLWLKRTGELSYFYAKRIDPAGPYFHMFLESPNPDGSISEFELQIPHTFVKAVLYAADFKGVGFVAP